PHVLYQQLYYWCIFFFSSRRRHTRFSRDWSSDVCSSDLDTVWVLVNMVQLDVPSGRKSRVIYHPPGVPAIDGSTGGMRTGSRKRSEERRVGKECRSRWSP